MRSAPGTTEDRNSLAFWFPRIESAGLPVPRTRVVHSGDLTGLLDGEAPEHYDTFIATLRHHADEIGYPCFLRSGHGSGKHEWRRTCFLPSSDALERHVFNIVEWSHMVDLMGLPTNVWAVRELLDTAPLFTCAGYCDFPVVREFRCFVRDDWIEHCQPYWPPDAVEAGDPDVPDWRERLAAASTLNGDEAEETGFIVGSAAAAVGGGYWSVDLLQDRAGKWWLTDMAEGERSFRWDPAGAAGV